MRLIVLLLVMLSLGCTSAPNIQVQGVELTNTSQIEQQQGDAKAMMVIGGAVAASGVLAIPLVEDRGDAEIAYPIIMGGAGAILVLAGVIYYYTAGE